jgi:hypothetical protein
MQPYFFPYFGYFQLISATDIFVIYDDTQLISRGWVNRNRILVNGEASLITLPLKKSHFQENIRCRYFTEDIDWHKEKILKGIRLSYARAPYFNESYPLIESILDFQERNVALFNENLIKVLCEHLGIATTILISSKLGLGEGLSGTDRIIAIMKGLQADIAINPIGGFNLYSCDEFMRHGVSLKFIKMTPIPYRQFGNRHLPNLSIIDVLMFLKLSEIQARLSEYSLVENFTADSDEA